ncbi:type II toxin-antitoxin system RelB/DinJ family antitoxin [Butyrivibrio sp. AC2005]|uniref:type II toxin-antitoxin system RelB/DinJ family antitoxin n=1 Tax=Butyrivibrio sp. AC2005 TaxID=1280672 RepID=UPI000413995B|nr:type II toxin-antitoxin system RelB/DinJ family antitoxin [Butyrivibrio sp. AC2005]
MASTIQVRVDDDLKHDSDRLFKNLGTDTTTAIRMFLKKAVASNGFPFDVTLGDAYNPIKPLTEDEFMSKLQRSREHAAQGKYRDADDVISDMRGKYGL